MHKNHISSLMNSSGAWTTDSPQLGLVLIDYFQHLFTSQRNDTRILDNIPLPSLSQSDITFFNQPFSMEEIKAAIWNMGVWKAPGPDGIHMGFYKDNWDLVKHQILQTASYFFSGLSAIHQINFIDPQKSSALKLRLISDLLVCAIPFTKLYPNALLTEFPAFFLILSMRIKVLLSSIEGWLL